MYDCPIHGRFDVRTRFSDDVVEFKTCLERKPCKDGCLGCDDDGLCKMRSSHVISPPAAVIIQGGTGAGSGRR